MAEEKKYTIIAMSIDLKRRIDALVGPDGLSVFIAEAVERELKRREPGDLKLEEIELPARAYIN